MTRKIGIDSPLDEGITTAAVPAVALVAGDQIILANGKTATVTEVSLKPHGGTSRDRKAPHCHIRVSIPSECSSSGMSVTAKQSDCFAKLVGVDQA